MTAHMSSGFAVDTSLPFLQLSHATVEAGARQRSGPAIAQLSHLAN